MPRRMLRRLSLVSVLLTAAIAFPLGVIASHQFSDVPTTSPYHGDIDALADAGITTGCGGGKYCPTDFVTRQQMAAFLNRLGALGAGKTPVVNAAKVDGHDKVLPAEDIVIEQMGPWFPSDQTLVTVEHYITGPIVTKASAGLGSIIMPLDSPGVIGGVVYAVKSIEVCHGPSGGVSITTTRVYGVTNPGEANGIIHDDTIRPMSPAGCYTLTDPTLELPEGGVSASLILDFDTGTTFTLGTLTTTWTPLN